MITVSKTDPEFQRLFESIHAYEDLTGLVASSVCCTNDGLWIEWIYPDGAWAGVFSCDMPLNRAVKKLHTYINSTSETVSHDTFFTKAS